MKCIVLKSNPKHLAKALDNVDLPDPGQSSINKLPPANKHMIDNKILFSFPRITLLNSEIKSFIFFPYQIKITNLNQFVFTFILPKKLMYKTNNKDI